MTDLHMALSWAQTTWGDTFPVHLEGSSVYIDFGYLEAVVIEQVDGEWQAWAMQWAPDHGVNDERELTDGSGEYTPMLVGVEKFLHEEKERQDKLEKLLATAPDD